MIISHCDETFGLGLSFQTGQTRQTDKHMAKQHIQQKDSRLPRTNTSNMAKQNIHSKNYMLVFLACTHRTNQQTDRQDIWPNKIFIL